MKREHRIVAKAFDRKGNELARAENNYRKSHPLQAHFAKLAGMPERVYLHAEVAALLRCGDKQPHTLYITRYGADGRVRLAAPCPICQLAIKAYGVKEVVHT